MSRKTSTHDSDDQSIIISTTANYPLCVESQQNETIRERTHLERANSCTSSLNDRSKDLKRSSSSGRKGSKIKFFSLRKMIKGEKNDKLTNYDVPSTLSSSLTNSLTASSTTNSFETASSKSSSKASFFKTFLNTTLLSSSSTSSIRSTNSTPTISPVSKINSSQSLISGTPNTMNAMATVTKSIFPTINLLPIVPNYLTTGVGETNNAGIDSNATTHHKKVLKSRNRKKFETDTLYSCLRVRSTSISGGLTANNDSTSGGVHASSSDLTKNYDANRLAVTVNRRTLKPTLSFDQEWLASVDSERRDELRNQNSSETGFLLIDKINKEKDESTKCTADRSTTALFDQTAYKSADLVDISVVDGGSGGGDGDQLSCLVVKREINLDKGDRASSAAQYQLTNRSECRKSAKKNRKSRDLKNLNLNKSKSANDLDDSNSTQHCCDLQSKALRSISENQLIPKYEQQSVQSVKNNLKSKTTLKSAVIIDKQCSSTKLNSHHQQKGTTFGRLKTLISVKSGLTRSKKDRIRESLNNQSTNCIEQLLFHEQCKLNTNISSSGNNNSSSKFSATTLTTSLQSTAAGLKNEIKMKFRRSDADYNLTKSMKTVDHKDLTLMQILALKPIRSKLKSLHQEKLSEKFFNSDSNNKKSIHRNIATKLFNNNNNKMVLPELSSSPVCAENAPTNDCFVDSAQLYARKTELHLDFDSKFLTDENLFAFDENVSKNQQDIYNQKQPQQFNDEPIKKKAIHQCDKQAMVSDQTSSVTSVNTNASQTTTRKWIQLAGHEQSFVNSSKPGIILKKNEQNELTAYRELNEMNDQIIEFIPKFYSVVKTDDGQFIELQDLLSRFDNQCNIIDLKMGTRTFLESDVTNIRARPDLYEKLIKIDSTAATQDEHQMKAITKLRYMTFRENLSSSSTLGFRIEGFKCKCNGMIKDFKYLRKEDEVKKVLSIFMPMNKELRNQLLKRLKLLKARFKESDFFKNHEVVGSSLLIIHDDHKIGVWMIDFGRTVRLPEGVKISHENTWNMGNHEDGYLTGLNNLIRILKEIA